MSISTDFVCIGRSGPTVDGRTIERQWLLDAAATYDTGTYTALIWPDHMRVFGNYGSVLELKSETEGDAVALYARLRPNTSLHIDNQRRQHVFSSMELQPNFANTGKCYLVGLGVTDSPASLGAEELRFSERKQGADNIIAPGVELLLESDAPPRWFAKFFKGWKSTPETHEESMDDKQFSEITQTLGDLTGRVKALGEAFAAQSAEKKTADPEAPKAAPELPAEPPRAEDKTPQIMASLEGLRQDVAALTKRLEAPKPGVVAPETTGPATIAGII